ncbi:GuaB3 family IMP dehydrogenase-related protein [Egicoccus sp. AB-alg2]|uniref:GuaB3 family IMP dehydrogenase-related protein n=1 Tax=Egicoccus sp. AB-alg2 TaxID=3242693 RepID=UPI00359E6C6F
MQTTTIGGAKQARVGYELADVSLVPSRRTRDAELVDVGWSLDAYRFDLPILGAPLDAVMSPTTAGLLGELGGLGVLALEGLWTRYEDPEEVLAEIAGLAPGPDATVRLQQLYHEPVREELIGRRVEQLKASGQLAAGSVTPQKVERYHRAALEAGLDLLLVNGVTVTAQHVGLPGTDPLDLKSFTARYDIPVVVGGVGSAKSALHLMRTGAVGVLVGTGSSSVETTRGALGIHVPLATAIAEVAAARMRYLEESGRYVHVIAAGGIRTGGDLAKAIACGADAVMLGRALASADEAPGRGAYWGLAAAHHELPRGRYDRVEPLGPMQVILNGPGHRADGTVNLVGGLRRVMGITGYESLARLKDAELSVSACRH